MFDYANMKLMHRHGSEWVELERAPHHDPAEHDPERLWGRGVRLFRCKSCEEEVAVMEKDEAADTAIPG